MIQKSSPFRSQIHILPISEKERINSVILQQNKNINVKKLLVVIDKKSWPTNFNLENNINENFEIIINNEHYFLARTGF